MGDDFFSQIIYSSSNEDGDSERKALSLQSTDIVFCVGGSGSRAFELLVDGTAEIYSVDFNEHQNHLIHFKIAAYKALDYRRFVELVGLYDSDARLELFSKISPLLPTATLQYWRKNHKMIEVGVLYCGVWERLLAAFARLAYFREKHVIQLLSFSKVQEQKEYWDKHWDNGVWRLFLSMLSNRFLWKYIIREPGIQYIPDTFSISNYMISRFRHIAEHSLFSGNEFIQLIFTGKYQPQSALPLHLREEYFGVIKANIDKITVVTASMAEYLATTTIKFDAFSLSDFSSYAPPEVYREIWSSIIRSASPNARFCERQFLVKYDPSAISSTIKRSTDLENLLASKDKTFIYTFCAGAIIG